MALGNSPVLSIELAIGQQMGQFYQQISADTTLLQEFVTRGLAKSIVWVPARMIDSVEEMLAEWRASQSNHDRARASATLPVMMVALAKDFETADAQWGRAVTEALPFVHETDPLRRMYKLRTTLEMQRMQVVVMAQESHSARSLASQFALFCQSHSGRCFTHQKQHAGCVMDFPVQLADMNLGVVDTAVEQKNLTILTIDLRWLITNPFVQAPGAGQANDGQAAPAGYPVVQEVSSQNQTSRMHSQSTMAEHAKTQYQL